MSKICIGKFYHILISIFFFLATSPSSLLLLSVSLQCLRSRNFNLIDLSFEGIPENNRYFFLGNTCWLLFPTPRYFLQLHIFLKPFLILFHLLRCWTVRSFWPSHCPNSFDFWSEIPQSFCFHCCPCSGSRKFFLKEDEIVTLSFRSAEIVPYLSYLCRS